MCNSPCRSETGGTFFSRIWTGDQSTGVMFAPNPMVTEVGDQPLLSDFETESHRTEFGMGCGNQCAAAMYAPEPDEAGMQIIHSRLGPSTRKGPNYVGPSLELHLVPSIQRSRLIPKGRPFVLGKTGFFRWPRWGDQPRSNSIALCKPDHRFCI